jgi:hypothetical protein
MIMDTTSMFTAPILPLKLSSSCSRALDKEFEDLRDTSFREKQNYAVWTYNLQAIFSSLAC